jgi:predicted PurR-regulated permease PerM
MPSGHTSSRRGHGALILVVLIALAIILIMSFAGGNSSYVSQVSQTRKQGKQMARDLQTQQVTILFAQYRQENSKLPGSWEDLESVPRESTLDPWGKPMSFSFETDKKTGRTTVTFKSDGPDGEPNTGDEVSKTDTLPF